MPIALIQNEEGGGSIRTKLNQLISLINDGTGLEGSGLAAALFASLEVADAPAGNEAPGSKGQWHWDDDANDLYLCVDTNKWVLHTGVVTKF